MTQSDLGDAVRDLEDLGKTNADVHNECDYVLKNFMIRQNARAERNRGPAASQADPWWC